MTSSLSYPVASLLLIGPTGSGKSPLGDHIAAHGLFGKRCHHFDFGAELRAIASHRETSQTFSPDEILFVDQVLEQGLLLENERFSLAAKILKSFLIRVLFRAGDLLVLNGIPRHSGQVLDIAPFAKVSALIVLECSIDAVFSRIRENTGGDRTDRQDDDKELVAKKLHTFLERTSPLVLHYETSGTTIYRVPVDGLTTTPDVYQHLLSLAASNPPFSLVAEPPQR